MSQSLKTPKKQDLDQIKEESNDVKQEDEIDVKMEEENQQQVSGQKSKQKTDKIDKNTNKRDNEVKVQQLAEQENGSRVKRVKTEAKQINDESDEDEENVIKFKQLEHHGVLFPQHWVRHNVQIKYDGQPLQLTLKQEEMATYWAQSLGTVWQENSYFRKNFSTIFLKTFDTQHQDLSLFNFQDIQNHLEKQREIKKNRGKEEREKEKKEKQSKDSYYGGALVDGIRERIAGYVIEPPTLFRGRGTHPKAGFMKARIMPEIITINISEDCPIPVCTMPGHSWGEIVHKYDVTWLAAYKDNTVVKSHKYFFLAATSKFKSQNDMKKYEKARLLQESIESIRKNYQKKMNSSDEKDRQLAVATYLIDKLALRVGNEKGEDEADTVGCCSLRVEHITIEEGNKITFDFLGKDSMRYQNTVQIDPTASNNIKQFLKGKKPQHDLFDRIDASTLNDYLRTLLPSLSAKVFRTYNASSTLQNQLDKSDSQKVIKMDIKEKLDFYENAVKQVAILCNHQKTVSKNFDVQVNLMKEKLDIMEQYQKELKQHLQKFAKGKDCEEYETKIVLEEKPDGKNKEFVKNFPGTKDKTEKKLEKLEQQLKEEKSKVDKKESNKDIALGTSKTNYNDPRISVAWGKAYEMPIEKIFPKTLRDKFLWAMSVEPEWKF